MLMASYVDESELWKCPKHPYKRRRTGICPTCLRERLIALCPECANSRPCSCCTPPVDSTTSSSSSSSSFSLFQFSGSRRDNLFSSAVTGDVNRVSNLIENEPAFRKSRSLAIPFLRSQSKYAIQNNPPPPPRISRSKINFWSLLKVNKNNKCELHDDESNKSDISGVTEDYSMMMRSRSVAVGTGHRNVKRTGWYFPSSMKVFRQSKTSKLQVLEQLPMHRG